MKKSDQRNMRKFPKISILMMSVACLALSALAGPTARIHCAQPRVDFGRRMDTEKFECEFGIENRGDVTLRIEDVRASCGCTVASISERRIAPGGRASLMVAVDLTGRSGDFDKEIRIASNDPEQSVLELWIAGEVTPSRAISPRHVFFRALGRKDAAMETVEVEFDAEPELIASVETRCDYLEAVLQELERGRRYRVEVRATPPYPAGEVQGSVYVKRPDGDVIFTIPVWVQIVSDIMHSPQKILIYADEGEQVTRQIIVRKGSAKEFKITGVDVPDPAIESSVHRLGDYGYRIQLDGIPVGRSIHGTEIIVRTDSDESASIAIPFEFREER
jgi:hypothetical protein